MKEVADEAQLANLLPAAREIPKERIQDAALTVTTLSGMGVSI